MSKDDCKHDQGHYFVTGASIIGWGTCLDCGKQIGLDDMFNWYMKAMDQKMAKMDELIRAAEK